MCDKCNNVKLLNYVQRLIIEKHIDNHKWFNGIEDKTEAIIDFINRFAWIEKEVFCMLCPLNDENLNDIQVAGLDSQSLEGLDSKLIF